MAVYPLFLIAEASLDNTLIPLLWMVTAAGLVAAGAAPLGRSRYLLPLSWIVMSLAYDGLTYLDVLDRPDQDWIPVTFALILLLPAGLLLLYAGASVVRIRESRRQQN